MSAPKMKRDLAARLQAVMQPGEKPVCSYQGNGVIIHLLADALVTWELDDRDTRCPNWIETERVLHFADDDELSRRHDFMGKVEWEVKQWGLLEADEDGDYFGNRRERIRLACSAMLAEREGGIRPMGATPTVAMSEACGF